MAEIKLTQQISGHTMSVEWLTFPLCAPFMYSVQSETVSETAASNCREFDEYRQLLMCHVDGFNFLCCFSGGKPCGNFIVIAIPRLAKRLF
jgi:hypothetical protein